jgi:hypothetical protein
MQMPDISYIQVNKSVCNITYTGIKNGQIYVIFSPLNFCSNIHVHHVLHQRTDKDIISSDTRYFETPT